MKISLSVVVLACDEESNLRRCLPALAFADEVVVVNDRSVDSTVAVSETNGARVVSHEMQSFADQRNWAMAEAGLKHSWILQRLVHRDRVEYAPAGHGECVSRADGRFEYLKEPFLHYNFSKGWADWFERHNRYSTREAERILQALPSLDWAGCCSLDPVRRRTALRGLSYRLPARSLLRFIYVYVVRAGFLDGRAGLTYAKLQAMYETMITLKVNEAKL